MFHKIKLFFTVELVTFNGLAVNSQALEFQRHLAGYVYSLSFYVTSYDAFKFMLYKQQNFPRLVLDIKIKLLVFHTTKYGYKICVFVKYIYNVVRMDVFTQPVLNQFLKR